MYILWNIIVIPLGFLAWYILVEGLKALGNDLDKMRK